MDRLAHLVLHDTATAEPYISTSGGSGPFPTPPRDDRAAHGNRLNTQLTQAEANAESQRSGLASDYVESGIALEFLSDPSFKLKLDSLERQRSGIELLNSRIEDSVMRATVFVPHGKLTQFARLFEQYINEESKSGRPRHRALVESISSIQLAAVRSYWTDLPALYPSDGEAIWWEVWLRVEDNEPDPVAAFISVAEPLGITVNPRAVTFPERMVLLAKGTSRQLSGSLDLLNMLAELRRAKRVPSDFLNLPPRQQAEFIQRLLQRIQPPESNSPAVVILDTGGSPGHPLLSIGLAQSDTLAVDPDWSPADLAGHGTEMAGLALYGCLTTYDGSAEPIILRHRLESVKILPDSGTNEPDNYGAITAEAIARIEIAARERSRIICLAVTADGRDEGFPSSWSGELDQLASGALDDRRRLLVVAAGNTPSDVRHQYPASNQVHGIQDPSQAWNVLTVGAYTARVHIASSDYAGWQPIAGQGRLSPCSTTSLVWERKEWPLKPDVVLEGGNSAIDPNTGRADFLDDLGLLTTRLSPTGALLSATGETSAATAQAARLAAILQAKYPNFWPETLRGLIVHSAEWTPQMLAEFPYVSRHDRLRCYGYGVPNFERMLWSASNAATLIVQDALQPYQRLGSEMKTKDMHVHALPWPVEVLEQLGDEPVTMQVTLSYFIEPSPGRRGWTKKHRYASHLLRFEVRRPTETTNEFKQRLTRAAWEEEEERPAMSSDSRHWELGPNLRTRGSVHSDRWTGTASELAACRFIAVYPVTGWWRERPHLSRFNREARYSLAVSISTPRIDVDLYTPIATQVGITPIVET